MAPSRSLLHKRRCASRNTPCNALSIWTNSLIQGERRKRTREAVQRRIEEEGHADLKQPLALARQQCFLRGQLLLCSSSDLRASTVPLSCAADRILLACRGEAAYPSG